MSAEAPLILVVDDHDAGRFVKERVLERAGFRVLTAATGADALRLAREAGPDLTVLDVNLPDMHGVEVARQLKADRGVPYLQIIQITNTALTDADRIAALSAGADAYLTEPIEGEVLVATVHAHLRIRRTELRLAEAAAREEAARKDAEHANRLKDEFLAGLSHELRTPMNAILGWLWQLRYSEMSLEARERALASLERSARLQNQLINDLLDVSRISKGKLQLVLRVADVAAAVAAAIEGASHLAEAKGVRITADAPSALVCADVLRLQQVFTNLLTNAVQFTPTGGEVGLDGFVSERGVTVRVHDNGAGIDPEFLPFVFDKFRQAEQGLTRQHGGLGVGLSITHEVVSLHGGTISAASEGLGRGATFEVTLPSAAPSLRALQDEHPNRPVLTNVRVAVVGASPMARARAAAVLEMAGATVTTAATFDVQARSCDLALAGAGVDSGGIPTIRVDWLEHDGDIDHVTPTRMVAAVAEALRPQPHPSAG
jgi:two-component system, sensor histidine kinase